MKPSSLPCYFRLRSFCLFLAFVTCAGPMPLRAQPADKIAPAFRVISMVGSRNDLKYEVAPDKPLVSVPLAQSVSRLHPAPANGRLELFREIPPPPDAPPGTRPVRQILLTVSLPPETAQTLIVALPTGRGRGDPLIARVLPDDPRRHRAGTVEAVNLSRFQTAVALDDTNHILNVSESRILPMGQGRLRVLVQAAVQKNSRWQPAFRAEQRVPAGVRGFLFVSDYIPDPDYEADPLPPPALVRILMEAAPPPPPGI